MSPLLLKVNAVSYLYNDNFLLFQNSGTVFKITLLKPRKNDLPSTQN